MDKMFKTQPVPQGQPGQMQIVAADFDFLEDDILVIPEGFPGMFAQFKQFGIKSKLVMYAQG